MPRLEAVAELEMPMHAFSWAWNLGGPMKDTMVFLMF